MSKHAVSEEFDGLDAIENATGEPPPKRYHLPAVQIESKLRNETPEHFFDELSPAEPPLSALPTSSQRNLTVAREQPASTVKTSQARGGQGHHRGGLFRRKLVGARQSSGRRS
jgi:hypothetical protein